MGEKSLQVSIANGYSPQSLGGRAKPQQIHVVKQRTISHPQEICLNPADFHLKLLPFQIKTAAFSQRLASPPIGIPPSGLVLTNNSHPFATDQHPNNVHSWECN